MSKGIFEFFVVIAFCGLAFAELDINNINDLQQQLPAEFGNPNETLNNARTLFRDKCINVAGKENGSEIYQNIESGIASFGECLTNIINYTAIQSEISDAGSNGNLDLVFHKYCDKRPDALKCVEDFNGKLVPCLDEDEREHQGVIMRIVRSLLNFVCHRDGDQIALFIAEKGPECLQSKKDEIQQCVNSTFSNYIPKDGIENVKTLPKFVMGEKQCQDIQRLETCVVEHLETCTEITPANIVESMFRFIKNETVCRNMPSANHQRSSAEMPITGSLHTFVSLVSLVLLFAFAKIMQ